MRRIHLLVLWSILSIVSISCLAGPAKGDLTDAAKKGDGTAVKAAIKAGASADDLNNALVAACVGCHLDVVKLLVAAKADANYSAPIGCPLGLLAGNPNPRAAMIIAYLCLEGGAAPDSVNKDGGPLCIAAQTGQTANIKALLGGGADVTILNPAAQGKPLSQVATEAKHPEAARVLMAAEDKAAAKAKPPVGAAPK